jgi:hypothetical protein
VSSLIFYQFSQNLVLTTTYNTSLLEKLIFVANEEIFSLLWNPLFITVKLSLDRPLGIQNVEAPEFLDSRHIKVVRLSALRTGHLHLPGKIPDNKDSVTGLVYPRVIARPE